MKVMHSAHIAQSLHSGSDAELQTRHWYWLKAGVDADELIGGENDESGNGIDTGGRDGDGVGGFKNEGDGRGKRDLLTGFFAVTTIIINTFVYYTLLSLYDKYNSIHFPLVLMFFFATT